jgi:hypothetical protein
MVEDQPGQIVTETPSQLTSQVWWCTTVIPGTWEIGTTVARQGSQISSILEVIPAPLFCTPSLPGVTGHSSAYIRLEAPSGGSVFFPYQ